jgi:GT2 family glycosyltransferase
VNGFDYEVIVIDNHSDDVSWKELIAEFPEVKFIANEKNEGFAAANNKAIREAKGKYLLLLNPDTEIENDFLYQLIRFADGIENLGCIGVRMYDAKGNFLPESKRAIPDMINSFEKLFTNFKANSTKTYYRKDVGEYDIAEVEVITGAFFLCRKEVYEKSGGLDEAYFMYGEDIDLCYVMLQKGYKNYYYGKASILHHKGESTVKDQAYLKMFYGAMQIFVNKYHKRNVFKYLLLSLGLKLKYQIEKLKLYYFRIRG